ncbi:hypothetical protein [Streptomyces sp. NPDC053431]|uniref:hypothetical protein n=1 Tax=Streptomyces sp. NPDC053431 TaxID=3365703 RepID=UPI0037CF2F54
MGAAPSAYVRELRDVQEVRDVRELRDVREVREALDVREVPAVPAGLGSDRRGGGQGRRGAREDDGVADVPEGAGPGG